MFELVYKEACCLPLECERRSRAGGRAWSLSDTTCHLLFFFPRHLWRKAPEAKRRLSLSLSSSRTQTHRCTKQQLHHWHCSVRPFSRLFFPCQVGPLFDNFLFLHYFASSYWLCFVFLPTPELPLRKRFAFALAQFIFYRQEWRRHSQCAKLRFLCGWEAKILCWWMRIWLQVLNAPKSLCTCC